MFHTFNLYRIYIAKFYRIIRADRAHADPHITYPKFLTLKKESWCPL